MNGARLSPDGRTVAFSSPVGGFPQVFVTEIYYERTLGRDEEWAVPTLGGTPRRVASGRFLVPSPDGGSFFYLKSDSRAIFRAGKSGLSEETVYTFDNPDLILLQPLPFPSGTDLLVPVFAGPDYEHIHLYKVNVPNHAAADLGALSGSGYPSDVVWAEPGKSVMLSRTVNGLTNLWKYSLADRGLTQITSGPGPDLSPMPDSATKGIYFVNGKSSGFLTAYHVHSKESVDIVSEDASQPVISPDGKRVMYIKFFGQNRSELWVSDLAGKNRVKLASGLGLVSTLEWSPDSSQLAFGGYIRGESKGLKGYIVGPDGRGLRQIEGSPPGAVAWSADAKSLYLSIFGGTSAKPTVWKANADGSNVEKFLDGCCAVTDAAPDGKYLLGALWWGNQVGIYGISIADKKCVSLLPGMETFMVRFARDGKSFLYAVASRGEITFYRQAWRGGKLIGKPQIALKLPFTFRLFYQGNAYDFSRDLSTIVYARPGGQADLYLLSHAE